MIETIAKVPHAVVVIVGDGAMHAEIVQHVKALDLEHSVLMLGSRRDVPEILAALDCFCLPSETEGMPMTLLEAMAAALPIVITNVGAIPTVVEDGVSALLIPPKDPEALARALCKVAGDPSLAAAMGRAARQRVERDFSVEASLRNYEALYHEMLPGSRR